MKACFHRERLPKLCLGEKSAKKTYSAGCWKDAARHTRCVPCRCVRKGYLQQQGRCCNCTLRRMTSMCWPGLSPGHRNCDVSLECDDLKIVRDFRTFLSQKSLYPATRWSSGEIPVDFEIIATARIVDPCGDSEWLARLFHPLVLRRELMLLQGEFKAKLGVEFRGKASFALTVTIRLDGFGIVCWHRGAISASLYRDLVEEPLNVCLGEGRSRLGPVHNQRGSQILPGWRSELDRELKRVSRVHEYAGGNSRGEQQSVWQLLGIARWFCCHGCRLPSSCCSYSVRA